MPRGFSGVREASAEVEARRQSRPGAGMTWFRLKSGQETIVRFLEQDEDIHWAQMHEIPREGRQWGDWIPCLDQEKNGTPCPGCERDLARRFMGYINLIWYDAPVYQMDGDKRAVDRAQNPIVLGTRPQVAVWSSGIRVFEKLEDINTNFKGLTSRRFKVKRKGEGLSTDYAINPEDVDSGPQALTNEDRQLSEAKFDLAPLVKPLSYEEFMGKLGLAPASTMGNGGAQPGPVNPFLRNRS